MRLCGCAQKLQVVSGGKARSVLQLAALLNSRFATAVRVTEGHRGSQRVTEGHRGHRGSQKVTATSDRRELEQALQVRDLVGNPDKEGCVVSRTSRAVRGLCLGKWRRISQRASGTGA